VAVAVDVWMNGCLWQEYDLGRLEGIAVRERDLEPEAGVYNKGVD